MEKIDAIIARRIELAAYYNELLAEVDSIRPPEKRENTKHVYQTYAIYIEKEGKRDKLITHLRKKNIETQIVTYALHLQPAFNDTTTIGRLERSEKLYKNLLALPMCHSMTNADQERVITELKNLLED